jgi:hypothetical protein
VEWGEGVSGWVVGVGVITKLLFIDVIRGKYITPMFVSGVLPHDDTD